ncbi:MAG: hypothetical protein LBM60_00325, partial [Clostridium sp.]|nr:hypothetical protein [Clostridium sp.]
TIHDVDYVLEQSALHHARVHKFFQYIRYQDRNIALDDVDSVVIDYLKQHSQSNITIELNDSRNSRHFIINPDGSVVIPMELPNKMFMDKKLGNILDYFNTIRTLKEWSDCVNAWEYDSHLEKMYGEKGMYRHGG